MSDDRIPGAREVAELDAAYRSFPTAEEWPQPIGVAELWEPSLQRLEQARGAASPRDVQEVTDEAMRIAAIDTGAIEGLYETDRGFTFSVAAMAAAWEQELIETKGVDVAANVRAQLDAFDYAVDAAAHPDRLSALWLRQVHEVICAAQETYEVRTPAGPQSRPLPKGTYKAHPNHVRQADGATHSYAPVTDTPAEVDKLVEQLRAPAFARLHPVAQAAYAHYAFLAIHPFADGNGRVARILASVFLLRAASIPFTVLAEQKPEYLDALDAVDDGDLTALSRFTWDRAYDVMALITQELAARGTDPSSILGELATLGESEPSRDRQLDVVGVRLSEVVLARVRAIAGDLPIPPGIPLDARPFSSVSRPPVDAEWRSVESRNRATIRVLFTTDAPVESSAVDFAMVRIARSPTAPFELQLLWITAGEPLDVRRSEVEPTVSTMLVRRIDPWLRRGITEILDRLRRDIERQAN